MTTGLILGCSKHMPIKVDINETQADGSHTMTINEEQPNDSIFGKYMKKNIPFNIQEICITNGRYSITTKESK